MGQEHLVRLEVLCQMWLGTRLRRERPAHRDRVGGASSQAVSCLGACAGPARTHRLHNGRVENWRAHCRWRFSIHSLSIKWWVHSSTIVAFPVPAASNRAGGFPALGFPACLVASVMRPIALGALSALGGEPGNC